jgi:Permuted papain-like amidase enzyme, YaeF/YiiX, C92 family
MPESERPMRRLWIGRSLFAAGAMTLPLGLGVNIGFWIADRGVRWLPTLLGALLVIGGFALAAMIAGSVLMGPAAGKPKGRKRIVFFATMLLFVGVGRFAVHQLAKPVALTSLSADDFDRVCTLDGRQVQDLERGLSAAVRLLASLPTFKDPDLNRVLSADEEVVVLQLWRGFTDTAFVLDRVRLFHEDYMRFDLSRVERVRHVRSFLVTFAAELSLYRHASAVATLLSDRENVLNFIDHAQSVKAGSVVSIREQLHGLSDLSRVLAGEQYLAFLDRVHDARIEVSENGRDGLWRFVEMLLTAIHRIDTMDLATGSVGAEFGPLARNVREKFFPVQKGVAEWMGDTRVRRRGRYLIEAQHLHGVSDRLQPGDILLSRKNWYLSNLGLPGFWPHGLLYVGSQSQLAVAFDSDAEVQVWVDTICARGTPFSGCMAKRYPLAFVERGRAEGSSSLQVIEAISEGVVQNSLDHAAGDYLAAMRPRLSPLHRARAIARAFSFLGKPYDFDFDFSTDDALVCTELLWRIYRPQDGMTGLEIPLVQVMGRSTLPAQEIIKQFAAESSTGKAQLQFVLFLEGREADHSVVEGNEAALSATALRTKWDVQQP